MRKAVAIMGVVGLLAAAGAVAGEAAKPRDKGEVVLSWDQFVKITGYDPATKGGQAVTVPWNEVQDLLGVKPGCEDSLSSNGLDFVQAFIDDGKTSVGHADFVNVGKAQGDSQLAPRQILSDLIDLAADVSAGLAHERQKFPLDPLGQY